MYYSTKYFVYQNLNTLLHQVPSTIPHDSTKYTVPVNNNFILLCMLSIQCILYTVPASTFTLSLQCVRTCPWGVACMGTAGGACGWLTTQYTDPCIATHYNTFSSQSKVIESKNMRRWMSTQHNCFVNLPSSFFRSIFFGFPLPTQIKSGRWFKSRCES